VKVFDDVADVLAHELPVDLGTSEWHAVDQEAIDLFAAATGDHQWIHVDPARAADGPFGTTIAHGFLTLSLLPVLMGQVYDVRRRGMTINVGSNRVRFLAPVPVGGRVRASATLVDVEAKGGAARCTYDVVIELEGSDRPAAVVQTVNQILPPVDG
jgi:acyl dehydratase